MRTMRCSLRIRFARPPGRFPTVDHDPGPWWGAVAGDLRYELARLATNTRWWELVCEPSVSAAGALAALRRPETIASVETYVAALAPLEMHLGRLARHLPDLEISLARGPHVRGLDYRSSRAIVDFARRPSRLGKSVTAVLDSLWDGADVLLLAIASPEELLTGTMLALAARAQSPQLYVCLADHSYENFSLGPHLERLRHAGALEQVFDSIVASADERDAVLPALAERLRAGERPRGWLRAAQLGAGSSPTWLAGGLAGEGRSEAFSPQRVVWTRVSRRRCYWGRCAFCVQNVASDDPRSPSIEDVRPAVVRIAARVAAGARHFYFADEALSPHLLRVLSDELLARGLEIRWGCRAKLEAAFSPALAERMRAAGCSEVLFGVETVSPRLLQRMGKVTPGVDADRTATILRDMNRAGIGLHINLLAGFPSATLEETTRDVEWTIAVAKDLRSVTYTFNTFVLYAGSPMLAAPQRFGIEPVDEPGDLVTSHRYRVRPELLAHALAVHEQLPSLARRLRRELGWSRFDHLPGGRSAVELYQSSGHGALMKAAASNPFENPLRARLPDGASSPGLEPCGAAAR